MAILHTFKKQAINVDQSPTHGNFISFEQQQK
jgi:hypothetical protein